MGIASVVWPERSLLTVEGLEVPFDVATLDGFRSWVATLDEHGPRVCFSNGRVTVEMSPQSYRTHGPVVTRVNHALTDLAAELDLGTYFTPPSWFTHEPTALSTEPDGFLVRWNSFEAGQARINPERETEMLGRPDMVLEVVSRSSERKDLVEHMYDYARAGIQEYWIVDARGSEVVFRVLVLQGDAYAHQPLEGGWIRSPLFDRTFRLVRFTSRAGLPDFRLDISPPR